MQHQLRGLVLIGLLAVTSSASSEVRMAIQVSFELSSAVERDIERAACLKTYNLRLHSSFGLSWRSDPESEFTAHALCATHRHIENSPVAYEVDCDRTSGDWKCPSAREVIDVAFPDRHIFIRSDHASLEDAYAVVAHLVTSGAFEPGTVTDDPFGRTDGTYDECEVTGLANDMFVVDCQVFDARVKRDTSSGVAKFVRIAEGGTP